MNHFKEIVEIIGIAVDGAGVAIMAVGALLASIRFLLGKHRGGDPPYRAFKQDLGRAILLGLEFLVAGDIIHTVVVDPTVDNVLVLGLIVFIRTFLSITLQVEVEGRWPWQHADKEHPERL
jgi:uncharacterized membrane protein